MTSYIFLAYILASLIVLFLLFELHDFQTHAAKIYLDSNNIPWVDYSENGSALYRNPVTIARYAEVYYDRLVNSNSSENRDAFMNNVDWLVNNVLSLNTSEIDYAVLEYDFEIPRYNLTPPWISGMAHGEALPSLFNAYKITNNGTYLETAQMLLNSFFVTKEKNGATLILPNNTGWWYEEYAGPGAPVNGTRVLNGMIHALLGIYKYYNSSQDPTAKYLFDQGILALKNNLHTYDYRNGTWSFYDGYIKKLAPLVPYQKYIGKELAELFDITQEEIFKIYRDKWSKPLSVNAEYS